MTLEQKKELEFIASELRIRARRMGTLSALWDEIFDIEAFIAGQPTVLTYTAEQWIDLGRKSLEFGPEVQP
jgi:hypothetical protein